MLLRNHSKTRFFSLMKTQHTKQLYVIIIVDLVNMKIRAAMKRIDDTKREADTKTSAASTNEVQLLRS